MHPLIFSCTRNPLNFTWNTNVENSESLTLSSDSKTVYFFDNLESKGTAGIRTSKPIENGSYYFEILVKEPLFGTAVMFGFGTEDVCLHYKDYNYVHMIGLDENGWGLSHKGTIWNNGIKKPYCEPFFDKDTLIGVLLHDKKLHYFINSVYKGVAFDNVNPNNKKLYPMVSSTATDIELELVCVNQLNFSLQDLCCHKICNYFKDQIDDLALPRSLINYLKLL